MSNTGGSRPAEVPPRQEFRFLCQDDAVRWVETFASRIDYRSRLAAQIAYLDVTEQKEAEEALKRSGKQLAEAQRLAHRGNSELRRPGGGELGAGRRHQVATGGSPVAKRPVA
ncbi:MAG: PAS domain S-box protein [Anaerolineae bacterium]